MVHNRVDGWERISSQEYDIVILDWDLPDIQGIDILKRFRAGGGSTPVLMLTGIDLGVFFMKPSQAMFLFIGNNSAEMMYKHFEEKLIPLRQMSPELPIPGELEPIVAKMLAKKADQRYPSMRMLKEELVKLSWKLPGAEH